MESFFKGVLTGVLALVVVGLILAPIVLTALYGGLHLLWYLLVVPLLCGIVGFILEW